MLFKGNLVMFGPREVLLTSDNPVITQFVNGRRVGPIGMSEEKDEATLAAEQAGRGAGGNGADAGLPALVPQLDPTPGLPARQAVQRRQARVMSMLHTLPPQAQDAIVASMGPSSPASPPGEAVPASRLGAQPLWRGDDRPRPTRPGREQPGDRTTEQTAEWPAEETEDRPGGWPADWPGGRG